MRYVLVFAVIAVVIAACTPPPARDSLKEAFEGGIMKLTSPAFQHNGMIPAEYTCDGENVNPPLSIADIPEGTKTLALIVDDPDATKGTWTHWIVWNIEPASIIDRDSVPGIEGTNDFKKTFYGGPCAPSGTHRYFFKIYALDTELYLEPGVSKDELLNSMQDHITAKGELVGKYSRTSATS